MRDDQRKLMHTYNHLTINAFCKHTLGANEGSRLGERIQGAIIEKCNSRLNSAETNFWSRSVGTDNSEEVSSSSSFFYSYIHFTSKRDCGDIKIQLHPRSGDNSLPIFFSSASQQKKKWKVERVLRRQSGQQKAREIEQQDKNGSENACDSRAKTIENIKERLVCVCVCVCSESADFLEQKTTAAAAAIKWHTSQPRRLSTFGSRMH